MKIYQSLLVLILSAVTVFSADIKIFDLTDLATPATGDVFVIVDVSDPTGDANGTTKKMTIANFLAFAFASPAFTGAATFGSATGVSISSNGDGTLILLGLGNGSDEDWQINLDDTANTVVHSSSTGVTIHRYTGIGMEFGGNITPIASDGAALGTSTLMWSDLFLASGSLLNWNNGDLLLTHSANVLTLTGGTLVADMGATATGVTAAANDNDTSLATTAHVQTELTAYASDTVTFTGKTFDAAGTGNVLKFTDYKDFIYPHKVDGTGTTITTNDYTSGLSGLATSNGTGDTNANYAIFRIGTVPLDLDTAVAMTLKGFSIRVSGTDTDAAEFAIALFSPASSAGYSPTDFTSLSTFIHFDSGTLTSPAANDAFYFADVTLTGWAAALTAGRPFIIGIARRNGANDDSVTILGGTVEFGRTK